MTDLPPGTPRPTSPPTMPPIPTMQPIPPAPNDLPPYPSSMPQGGYAVSALPRQSVLATISIGTGAYSLVANLLQYLLPLIGFPTVLRVALGPLFAGTAFAAVAVALGHLARRRIRETDFLRGDSVALTGLILGYIGLAVSVVGSIVSAITVYSRFGGR